MRLNESQRELVLEWIAEGIKSNEMNRRAAAEVPPFKLTRQQVQYYRDTRDQDIKEISKRREFKALNTGLALKSERIEKRKELAALLEEDLFDDRLWLTRIKSVGGGPNFFQFEEEEFNKGEVDAYLATLNDIAREQGHLVHKAEMTTDPTGEIKVTFHNPYADDNK